MDGVRVFEDNDLSDDLSLKIAVAIKEGGKEEVKVNELGGRGTIVGVMPSQEDGKNEVLMVGSIGDQLMIFEAILAGMVGRVRSIESENQVVATYLKMKLLMHMNQASQDLIL